MHSQPTVPDAPAYRRKSLDDVPPELLKDIVALVSSAEKSNNHDAHGLNSWTPPRF